MGRNGSPPDRAQPGRSGGSVLRLLGAVEEAFEAQHRAVLDIGQIEFLSRSSLGLCPACVAESATGRSLDPSGGNFDETVLQN